jgi:hypothetical protein
MTEKFDSDPMWKWRRKNFKVEITKKEPSAINYEQGSFTLMTTGNGTQWSACTVHGIQELKEVKRVIDAAVDEEIELLFLKL